MARASSPALTHLRKVPVAVSVDGAAVGALRPARRFRIPVTLTNSGRNAISWSPANPLHLAYRWLDEGGGLIERDGLRTAIPGNLEPGRSLEVQLSGAAPDAPGTYELQVSLVLEGVHWACDTGTGGWTQVQVGVATGSEWPEELLNSPGGRALRGALAAAALRRELAGRNYHDQPRVAVPEPVPPPAPEPPAAPVPAPALTQEVAQPSLSPPTRRPTLAARPRNWLRKLFGTRNLQLDLQTVANAVSRQEQRSTDLQIGLDRLEQQLQDRFGQLDTAVSALTAITTASSDLAEGVGEVRRSLVGHRQQVDQLAAQMTQQASDHRTANELLLREMRDGQVAVELISNLRDLTLWAQANNDRDLLDSMQRNLGQLLHQVLADAERQGADRDTLALIGQQNARKLDSLLTRQALPLPSAGIVLVRNRFGLLAIQDEDTAAIAYYLSGELPEAGTVAIVERLLQPGDCFVDVGANVGIYALIAGRRLGPDGRLVAIEPMPSTAAALRTTLAINGLADRAQVHQCAAGAEAGTATLFSGATSGHSSLLGPTDGAAGAVEVPVAPGDAVVGELRPRLIKVDVEGWELDALEGLARTIRNNPDVSLVVECSPGHIRRRGLQPAEWFKRVRGFGGRCWRIDDAELRLHPIRSIKEIGDGGANLFLSRDLPSALRDMRG